MKPKHRKPAASAAQMPKTAEFIAEMMQKVSQFDSDSEVEAQSPSKAFLGTEGLIPKVQAQNPQSDQKTVKQLPQRTAGKSIDSILSPTLFQQQKQFWEDQPNDLAQARPAAPQQKACERFGGAGQAKPASKASALASEVEFLGQRSRVECVQQPQVLELSGGEDEFSEEREAAEAAPITYDKQQKTGSKIAKDPVEERRDLILDDEDYLGSLFATEEPQQKRLAKAPKRKQEDQPAFEEQLVDDDALAAVRAQICAPKQANERQQAAQAWQNVAQTRERESPERIVPQRQQKLVEEKVFKTLQRAPGEREQEYFLAASLQKSAIDKLNAVIALQYAPLFPTLQDMQQAVRCLYKLPAKLFIDCETSPFADVELSVDERQLAGKKFVLLAKLGRKNIKIECKRIKSNDSSVRFQRCQTSLRSGQVALVLDNMEQQEWILCVDGLQAERIGESVVCLVRGVQNSGEVGI